MQGDSRDYFLEYFRQEVIDQCIPWTYFVKVNESLSSYGVIRGLHFQRPPHALEKFIRVIAREVLGVAVYIRFWLTLLWPACDSKFIWREQKTIMDTSWICAWICDTWQNSFFFLQLW